MAVNLSEEQKKAADARHENLLVSAAAGAGKTSVLVARILSLITDKNDPADIDRILVVTFTRAAAAEMRERISRELSELLKEDPKNPALIRQSILLHNAQISTIDSFCTYVVRNYFQNVDLDPVFRIGEEGELKLLMSDCMDALFEDKYLEGDEAFYDLRQTYFSSDASMKDTILQVFRMASAMPYPEEWLEKWAGRLHEEDPEEEVNRELLYLRPYGDELALLVKEFTERFSQAKREKGLLDFSDLEHFALRILLEKDENGNLKRTSAAKKLAGHFREIMCDEYQDSNEIQELILFAVSKDGLGDHDRFMVGDVKQSIYGFRHAEPSLFIEKYENYAHEQNCERIDLHKNFRSRKTVINSVNRIFERLMTKETGRIDYDEDAALVYGADYPKAQDGAYDTEILLMDKKDPAFIGAKKDEAVQAEALMAAHRILELEGSLDVYDSREKTVRKAGFGDFAVIMRNTDDCELFRKVFQDAGIPARTAGRKGYFSTIEVMNILDYLRILDNPLQDIPMAGVFHSPIGGFSEKDMAEVRAYSREGSWYEACRKYAEEGPDIELKTRMISFLSVYDTLRESVSGNPVHQVIEDILELTDYRIFASGMPAGQQRAANLDLLVRKAKDFEGTSYHGLFNFIRYIEKLESQDEDFGEAETDSEGAGSVEIMTIHKSKGLEFPVVFLSCAAKTFSRKPIQATVLLHKDAGPGLMVIDRRAGKKKKDPRYRSRVKDRITLDQYAEEMRLLYVAMTRAKEKLVITGIFDDLEKTAGTAMGLGRGCEGPLDINAVMNCSSFMEWILAALAKTDAADPLCALLSLEKGKERCIDMLMRIETPWFSAEKTGEQKAKRALKIAELYEGEEDEKTVRLLKVADAFEYKNAALSDMPEKLSVSELKVMNREADEEADEEPFKEQTVIPYIPEFARKDEEEKVTGAARGTAYHFVLENLDYGRFAGKENEKDIEDEALRQIGALAGAGRLSKSESAAVNAADIRKFLLSGLGKRMAAAAARGKLKREQPFTSRIPASEADDSWSKDEFILVQGVIDAYFEEDGNIVIVDYKTDYLTDPSGVQLLDKYSKQLYYYKDALEAATGRKVAETWFYSIFLGKEVACPF